MSEEVMHNRTINLQGEKGRNLPMDRVNEFLNCDFKGNKYSIIGKSVKRSGHKFRS